MDELTVYLAPDGRTVIHYPAAMTRREALERVCMHLLQNRKSPSAYANMQKGGSSQGRTNEQFDCTASAAGSQEGGN